MKASGAVSVCLALMLLFSVAYALIPEPAEMADIRPEGTRAPIFGTLVAEDIVYDQTWTAAESPYLVKASVKVHEGVTLTIEPGTLVLMYANTLFSIDGTLLATGSKPYGFIEFNSVEYVQSTPGPRDWQGIRFLQNSTGSVMDTVKISYAASSINITNGASPIIRNSEIHNSYYYAINCGEDTAPIIENNLINTSTFSGIVSNNRSSPTIRNNTIDLCYYGIVAYSSAFIAGNDIRNSAFGIQCWNSSAYIYNNRLSHNIDGIFAFFSDPKIENNTITSSSGNATRFIQSNALFLNNTMEYNDVGVDIPYDSRGILLNMSGNSVNGQDVNEMYKLGLRDTVISDLNLDSGASVPGKGYYGLPTAQGSITLYDCDNITFENCKIENAMNGIFALNSTNIKIYNSEFNTSRKADLHLEEFSSVKSYNGSVNPERVTIASPGSYMVSYGLMQVRVLNYTDAPVENAVVEVRELSQVHFNVTTNASGLTPQMLIKNKRVSESGILNYTMTVEIWSEGLTFGDNPRNVMMDDKVEVSFSDLGDLVAPSINGTNIEHGQQGVSVTTVIVIRFSEKMNETSVEEAFTISNNVTGTFSWDGTELIFTPSANLSYNTAYVVTLDTTAADVQGNALTEPLEFSFTTMPETEVASSGTVVMWAVAIFALVGLGAFFVIRKG